MNTVADIAISDGDKINCIVSINVVEEEDEAEDSLHSALEDPEGDLLATGSLSRSRSGSVKSLIHEYELRCESLTTQDLEKSWKANLLCCLVS